MNAPVKAAAVKPADPHIISLRKPIITHKSGPETRTITLRDPTAGDFVAVNALPFEIIQRGEAEPDMKLDFKVGMRWLTLLSGHSELELEAMSKFDFLDALRSVAFVVVADGAEPKN